MFIPLTTLLNVLGNTRQLYVHFIGYIIINYYLLFVIIIIIMK
jgi:hypothetical protein